jgi:hypothetical protein
VYSESNSNFKPLSRIDTFFVNPGKIKKRTADNFFFLPFDSLAKRISETNIGALLKQKRILSWKQISEHYDARFNIPILKDSVIKNGIFLSFEDFKQNKPLETNFRFSNVKLTGELYIVNNGEEKVSSRILGIL